MSRMILTIAFVGATLSISNAQSVPLELDQSTVSVLEIDLAKLKVDDLQSWMNEHAGEFVALPRSNASLADFQPRLDALRQAGADRLVLVWRLQDLLQGTPLITAPTQQPELLSALALPLWKRVFENVQTDTRVVSGWTTFGSSNAIGQLRNDSVKTTDRFTAGLANPQLEFQWIIRFPIESREDLIALWPDSFAPNWLPFTLSPRQMVQDVSSFKLEWSLPPSAAMKMTVETIDVNAANRISGTVQQWIDAQPSWKPSLNVHVHDTTVTILANEKLAEQVFAFLVQTVNRRGDRFQATKALREIGIALHKYHATYGTFPSPAIKNDDGVELLSWRVAITPFINQEALANAMKLDQAWDSNANRMFTEMVVPNFSTPGVVGPKTAIRLPAFPGSMWDGTGKPLTFRAITDGSSNTIAAVIAPSDQVVPWTMPEVWRLDENNLLQSFFVDREEVTVLAFDGAVYVLKKAETTEEQLRGLLTIAGREPVDW